MSSPHPVANDAVGSKGRRTKPHRSSNQSPKKTANMKIELSKSSGKTLRAFSLSGRFQCLIATGVFALYYLTAVELIVPGALAFVPRTRNVENHNCRHHVSITKPYFADRESIGDTESPSFPTEPHRATTSTETKKNSKIISIRCNNLASMTNGQRKEESLDDEIAIVIDLNERSATIPITTEEFLEEDCTRNISDAYGGNLVCITGETGSGKSLLVSKVADLLTGGKATASLLHDDRSSTTANNTDKYISNDNEDGNCNNTTDAVAVSETSVEMVFSLFDEVHLSFVSNTLRQMGQNSSTILQQSSNNNGVNNNKRDASVTLSLKRVMSIVPTPMNENGKPIRQRMKSLCFINNHSVPLKVLKAISSRLVAVVNAPAAATALGRPGLRLSMIDSGVSPDALVLVQNLQNTYRECKKYRESLEKDLEQQVLSAVLVQRSDVANDGSSAGIENDHQMELLQHWVEELDGFERRMSDIQNSLCPDGTIATNQIGDEQLENILSDFGAFEWSSRQVDDDDTPGMYEMLLNLHDYLKSLDTRIDTAVEARDALASISNSDSARSALDRTRQLLLDAATAPLQRTSNRSGKISKPIPDASAHGSAKSKVVISTERAHEMLNLVEDALLECANFLDDDDKGMVATLRASRKSVSITTEEVFEYISEWNVLARKHGVSPYQLSLCHGNLKDELNGGVEARRMLPKAKIAEEKALEELEEACQVLTEARNEVCQRVSSSITHRLPRLGMENSKFEARLCPVKNPSYSESHLGVDQVDFYLLHEDQTSSKKDPAGTGTGSQDRRVGGKIETIASSGEKARILLAIECEIPGSISAIDREHSIVGEVSQSSHVSPVAVIYDEIDAHVGGRASVSVAQMLFDQSKACQVLSITHSPSLAAIADTHICVERGKSNTNGRSFDVVVNRVEGKERRKELARMASGDTVVDEAEVFAEALLRDASTIKMRSQKLVL